MEGHHIIRGRRRAVSASGRNHGGSAVHVHVEDNGKDVGEDVSGCPEALLPGALTRRLSACRPRLTLPPFSSTSSSSSPSLPTPLPPAPPSYLRLALSVCFCGPRFLSYFFPCS